MTTDDLIHHVAPIRNLIRTKEQDSNKLMTLCAMCYNTIKRANERVKKDQESLDIINDLMYREKIKYEGDVEVLHLLEILKNDITFENVQKKVVKPLKGLKIASYYGCYLVRPKEIGIDNPENPNIMDELVSTLGGEPIDFPFKTECCGAYETVDRPDIIANRTNQILSSAVDCGADAVAVSCPLCFFNLDSRQKQTQKIFPEFKNIPVLYFSQLLALALGCDEESMKFDLHYIDPKPLLKEKGLI
jgi:heterodisulfide reductase subunit B